MDWDLIIIYLAMGIWAYAVIYELFHRHWLCIPASIAEIIISAEGIVNDDTTLLAISFFGMLALTFLLVPVRAIRLKRAKKSYSSYYAVSGKDMMVVREDEDNDYDEE